MKYILGYKQSMTQIFKDDGTVVPVTRVLAGPNTVTEVRNKDKHGYDAVQVGAGSKKKLTKPIKGHLKELGNFKDLKEFCNVTGVERGTVLTVAQFQVGDKVDVIGWSKGKGFQGVVRRHGFHGHGPSHGHKDQQRMPGSIGSKRQGPVRKGQRMAGHMGDAQVTVKKLEIVGIDEATNSLLVKGAVPGARNSLLVISAK